ncbi:putative Pentatricopeptide repeat superfamily protein [Tripterygium wilfordii]|uniref:Putative Pentatricopeptide repeat superfamily protein n=1 Tax=Tripterygium wilfordii TaxID=458696 RepID=A0A7J7BYW8_TRIWF|nr:putative Pentatricopeptide repeat superfamily protein [Tripterygium wilfordii]
MELSNLTKKKLRYSGCKGLSLIHSNGATSSVFSNPGIFSIHSDSCFRWYSTSSIRSSTSKEVGIGRTRMYATSKHVYQIIELIRSGDSELENKLSSMNVYLSIATVTQIFQVLTSEKVSALRFFHWIRHWQPEFYSNSDVCSLMIDNCGCSGDYSSMQSLLNDFTRMKGFRLNKSAFRFLPVLVSSNESLKKSVEIVVDVLEKVGGSSRASGIVALIEMLSAMDSFEMALSVIKEAGRRVSYYNILVREKCRRCDFNGAKGILNEMRQDNCPPPMQTYNYMLSSLCKNDKFGEASELLEDMDERFCPPDAITFEIFICHSCEAGKLDIASRLLDQMEKRGVEPRLTTHAIFIKEYFKAGKYEEAYNYVVDSSKKYKCCSNMNYSLLASLHLKRGNLVAALDILYEMIDKDVRPYYRVYRKVLKHLQKSGREDLAKDLNSRLSSFSLELTKDIG